MSSEEAPPSEPSSPTTQMRGLLNRLPEFGLGIGVPFYVAGFFINSIYLGRYSISGLDLVQSRYILNGALFAVFFTVTMNGFVVGWNRFAKYTEEDQKRFVKDVIQDIAKVVALIAFPLAIALLLPFQLADSSLSATKSDRFTSVALPFLIGWIASFASGLVLGIGVRLCDKAGLAFAQPLSEAFTPIRPYEKARSYNIGSLYRFLTMSTSNEGVTERLIPFGRLPARWFITTLVAITSLNFYAAMIFETIPQEIGGGEPVLVSGIRPSAGAKLPMMTSKEQIYLVARTDELYIFQVSYPAQPPTIVEVKKDEIDSLMHGSLDIEGYFEGLAPPNDLFLNARSLEGMEIHQFGWTTGATIERYEPDHLNIGARDPDLLHNANYIASRSVEEALIEHTRSVWYSWTPMKDGLVTIDTCETGIDSVIAVYTGYRNIGLLSMVRDDNNGCHASNGGWGSRVVIDATAGKPYYIAVDVAATEVDGWFVLSICRLDNPATPAANSPACS